MVVVVVVVVVVVEKLFVNLVLDGTTDWAILDKSALQVYTGNSLSITMHKLPKFISKNYLVH